MPLFTYTTRATSTRNRARRASRLFPWALMLILIALWPALISPANAASPVGNATGKGPSPDAPNCDPNWQVVPSPNTSPGSNRLTAADVAASGDVWAVGQSYDSIRISKTLIEQRNGGQWNIVPSPNAGTGPNYLNAVAALSSSYAWAVGSYRNTTAPFGLDSRTLIEFWNGSQWSGLLPPNVGTASNILNGVAIVSANNAWAVGQYMDNDVYRTLIEHWNGSTWSVITSPNVGSNGNRLLAVTVVSANEIYAVGDYSNGVADRTLILRWNGSSWNVMVSPNIGPSENYNTLEGVTGVATGDVWAIGSYLNSSLGSYRTLTLHWNGTAWSIVNSPNGGSSNNFLKAIDAASANDVWATGFYLNSTINKYQTLILHWNGIVWRPVASPDAGMNLSNRLYGVAVASPTDVWAVGAYDVGNTSQTLTERLNPCN